MNEHRADNASSTNIPIAAEGSKSNSVTSHRDFISARLEQIWRCQVPLHYICIITPDGEHHELGIRELEIWTDAIQRGEATVRNPPQSILPQTESSNHTTVSRSLPYTPSLSTTNRFGDVSGLLPLKFAPGNTAAKGITWMTNGVGRVMDSLSFLQSILRKWENELDAWNALWYASPDLLHRSRSNLPSYPQDPSAFQTRAWEFVSTATSDLIARVQGTNDDSDSESMNTEQLQSLACMIDITVAAIGELFNVKKDLHPGQGVLADIENEMPLSNYETLTHFTIAVYAYLLIVSKPPLLWLESTDVKLFRTVLHVMTNPQIRVPTKVFDVLLNLSAVRMSTEKGFWLSRPYEVATFALCMSSDIRFFDVQDRNYGIPGLLNALEDAQNRIATQGKGSELLWLRMYKTLHAINDMFLQVPGLIIDLDVVIKLMKLVLVKPPNRIKRQFRHILINSIAAVLCGSPGVFRQIFPYQRRNIQLCLDTLRAWTDAEKDPVRKREMLELCSLLAHICYSRTNS